MTDQKVFSMFMGEEHDIVLPSGKTVTIRENNGEDEGALSNIAKAKDGSNILNFLTNIITKFDTKVGAVTPEELDRWPRNDVYYLLFKQRLINLGDDLLFKNGKVEISEDLRIFDLASNFKRKESDAENFKFSETQALPYLASVDNPIEFTVPNRIDGESPLQLRFKVLSMKKERESLERDSTLINNNTFILDRGLEIFYGSSYQRVTTLNIFSSKQMKKIRSVINKYDPQFNPFIVHVESATMQQLFQTPDFYYPEEEIS